MRKRQDTKSKSNKEHDKSEIIVDDLLIQDIMRHKKAV